MTSLVSSNDDVALAGLIVVAWTPLQVRIGYPSEEFRFALNSVERNQQCGNATFISMLCFISLRSPPSLFLGTIDLALSTLSLVPFSFALVTATI